MTRNWTGRNLNTQVNNTNTAGQELTNDHTKQGQETNQIRTQEAGTHDTHDRGLTTGAHSGPTFCYGFWVERHVSWKRCATGFEIRFLLFGGCVKNVSPISSNVYINHAVLKRQLAQWVQVKSFNMCPLQFGIRIIEDIRRHVCPKSF